MLVHRKKHCSLEEVDFWYDPCRVATEVRLAPDPREWAERFELAKITLAREKAERERKSQLAEAERRRRETPEYKKAQAARKRRAARRARRFILDMQLKFLSGETDEKSGLRLPRRHPPPVVSAPINSKQELALALVEHPEQFPDDYIWPYGGTPPPEYFQFLLYKRASPEKKVLH